MRVTMQSLNRHVQNQISARYDDMSKLQEQMSTGKRLLHPSDDPIDIASDLKMRSKEAQLAQYSKNIDDGTGFMTVSDTAMQSMNDLMQRFRELAVQGSTDTLTSNERLFIQTETQELLRQMIALGNTNYKGDYVFAGTQSKITPYPVDRSQASSTMDYQQRKMAYYDGAAGGVGVAAQLRDAFTNDPIRRLIPGTLTIAQGNTQYTEGTDFTVDYVNGTITPLNAALAADMSDAGTFVGPNYATTGFQIKFEYIGQRKDIYGDPIAANGVINRETEAGTLIPINIPGDQLFTDVRTGVNALDVLIQLNQNLLTGTSVSVGNSIDQVQAAFKTILAAQATNGARMNRFETTSERNADQTTETTRIQSNLEDADMAKTVTDFSLMESVYNAALKSAARVLQPSLVDFL
jgi:flagellar hook-associated protein 3 FlgL